MAANHSPSLRERCTVSLRVCTDVDPCATRSKLTADLVSTAGRTPPASPMCVALNRRSCVPPPLPPPPRATESGPSASESTSSGPSARQFIPHLHTLCAFDQPHAFATDSAALPAGNWTHAVRILRASKAHLPGSLRISDLGPAQVLDLFERPRNIDARARDGGLPLRREHLLLARDFLALALPYYSTTVSLSDDGDDVDLGDAYPFEQLGLPPVYESRTDPVRVLLAGPVRAVLAIALVYTAYASGRKLRYVMDCVGDEGDDADVCAVLGPDSRMGLTDQALDELQAIVNSL
ncbi:unnamed protein product [Mycena citricolor]|uniref:Uncharacterized protein n=1 Tax=Mycena citricolor TaxID=2018698 RepID=A0AAD2GZD6_9AGAR|nr:unnamed protein product [Mycena citricolor]